MHQTPALQSIYTHQFSRQLTVERSSCAVLVGGVNGWTVKEGMMENWQRRRQVLLFVVYIIV